jgi:hypothetical protein
LQTYEVLHSAVMVQLSPSWPDRQVPLGPQRRLVQHSPSFEHG